MHLFLKYRLLIRGKTATQTESKPIIKTTAKTIKVKE